MHYHYSILWFFCISLFSREVVVVQGEPLWQQASSSLWFLHGGGSSRAGGALWRGLWRGRGGDAGGRLLQRHLPVWHGEEPLVPRSAQGEARPLYRLLLWDQQHSLHTGVIPLCKCIFSSLHGALPLFTFLCCRPFYIDWRCLLPELVD